jgi:proline dehydrogenase
MSIFRTALLWGSENRWLERQFRSRRFAKKAITRFMPGEDLDAALTACQSLGDRQIACILTRLGENVSSTDEIADVVSHYRDVLERVRAKNLDTHISIKLTQLGLDRSRDEAFANLDHLVQHAATTGNFVWIDMESTPYVDPTLEIYMASRKAHPNVGVCVQAYLYRTKDDLTRLLEADATIRLVKGAYREPPDLAFPKKRDVDDNFFDLSEMLITHAGRRVSNGQRPPARHAIATHDLALIERIRQRADAKGGSAEGWEIDMLYGIRANDQTRLVEQGVPVRVLISYGEAWFPWYMRRLAERPANVGFVLKSLVSG